MDNNSDKPKYPPLKPVIYPSGNKEEGILEDVSVGSVKNSITKNILVFLIGIFLIPFIVYLFSVFVLPIIGGSAFTGVTLTYWGVWEDKKVMENVIFDFERQHPNIKIDYKKQDIKAVEKYVNMLATRINNGTGPDMFRFHNSWVIQIQDFLLPLPSDVLNESQLLTQHYDVVRKDVNVGGAYYGIPLGIDTLALFINTEVLNEVGEKPPGDWNDLFNLANKLTIIDAGSKKIIRSGIAMGTYDNVDHAPDIFSLLMYQNGISFNNMNNSLPSLKNALSYYTSFSMGDTKVWDSTFENSKLAFAKGKVAMIFGYSWDVLEIKKLNPNLTFAVYPVPHIPNLSGETNKSATIASYWIEGVSSRTKYQKEAMEFLKFLTRRENIEKIYAEQARERLFGEPYPRRDMASLLAGNSMIYPFVQQADNCVSTPFSSDTYDKALNDSLNQYLANGINGLLSRSASVDTASEIIIKGTDQILRKYAM